jgi:hypothetical protein
LRLTVASGVPRRRAAADKLPASTAATRIDIASKRSNCFRLLEGYIQILLPSAK